MWLLQNFSLDTFLIKLLAAATILIFILPLHELAHGWIALKLGDDTAKYQGRLTLSPMSHIDPLGAICMIIFGFGWAKPVPINPTKFKNPRSGMAITALAGPVSNIIAAFFGVLIFNLMNLIIGLTGLSVPAPIYYALEMFFVFYTSINCGLAVFNLIPLPPLDGSKILEAFLPDKIVFKFYQNQRMITLIVFALLFVGVLDVPLRFFQSGLYSGVVWLAGLPFGIS